MLPPRVDVRPEGVVVNAVEPYISDKRVQILQRPRIPFNASLPSKLVEVSGRSFSEFSAWPCSVDRGLSDLLDPPREIPCGFLFVACSSALAKAAESFDAFVDVPLKYGYFKGQTYRLVFEMPTYATAELTLGSSVSGWYFGNLVLGGLIGMLIVDPLTSAMYNLTPDKVQQPLTASQAEVIRNGKGVLVVLVSQTTQGERAAMVRVN
jgi:hypothetical protein